VVYAGDDTGADSTYNSEPQQGRIGGPYGCHRSARNMSLHQHAALSSPLHLLCPQSGSMKTIIAVTLCVCLLLAPVAQSADFATTIINACSSGMTSTVCKGVMARANKVCAGKDGQGSCVKAAIGICQVCLHVWWGRFACEIVLGHDGIA